MFARNRADMTLDDILLKVLEDGPATVNDIVERLEGRVRIRLNMLRARGVVIREGRGGAHREFTYRLLRPGVAAKAVREKGLARAPPEPR
jgi:Mn-dependent DtxR family transcriptional regulator